MRTPTLVRLGTASCAVLVCLVVAARVVAAAGEPSWAYPAGTTTGIAAVDAAIRAMASSDARALESQFLFTTRGCTGPGIGEIKCPEGKPIGTPVDVFSVGQCEGVALPPGDPALATTAAAMTAEQRYLFAVGRLGSDWRPSEYVLIFGSAEDSGAPEYKVTSQAGQAVMIFTDSTGIRSVNTGCGSGVAQRLQDVLTAGFVLAPRTGPGAPGTGTGLHRAREGSGHLLMILGALFVAASPAVLALSHRRR